VISGLIWIIAPMAGFAAGIAAVKLLLLRPARQMRVDIRPWRGDPWPRGVQEEYDIRFDLSAGRKRRTPIAPTWSDIVVTPTDTDAQVDPEPPDITAEELPGGAVVVEHLGSVSIHHPHH
jgi:hypothetical protein